MKLKLTIISIFITLCVVMFACKDENTTTSEEKADIVLSPTKLTVVAIGGTYKFTIHATDNWTAKIHVEDLSLETPDWLTLLQMSGSASEGPVDIKIECDPSDIFEKRIATIVFSLDSKPEEEYFITVEQLGADDFIFNPKDLITVDAIGGQTKFTIQAIGDWNAVIHFEDPMLNQTQQEWLILSEVSGSASKEEPTDFIIQCEPNDGIGRRVKKIIFRLNSKPNEQHVMTVEQKGKDAGSELNAYIGTEIAVSNKYPSVTGQKVTVQSEIHGLQKWGDKNFTMNLPTSTDEFNRIIMTYRMGAGKEGCSAWDMLTTMAFKYQDEWWEIARVVTPYGNSFGPDFEKKFYFDVTEYLPMLKGATEFKLKYHGYDYTESRWHTAQITFDMYKGERDKNQIFSQKLYDSEKNSNAKSYSAYSYGQQGADIEAQERMGTRTITLPADVKSLKMKVVISGHGHDQGKFLDRPGYRTRNAAEFDQNFFTLKLNSVPCEQRGEIFIPCGKNYAQAGTAFFDRGNWCPGNPVRIEMWEFINLPQNGGSFDLDIDFERFESDNGSACYSISIDIFGFDK